MTCLIENEYNDKFDVWCKQYDLISKIKMSYDIIEML